ncbi:uncharacterized protein BT62DRAFT_1001726 [Guyanagaster necrorhizus]|uniref:Uncharacterized protein n=1 Tax=Guyanagaster necrorhizus TaxID=856835 RepID=A0A9P7W1J4_9AGAR|nr:uncharacterized protein BT62DRAFT_1001726 [Guyanagaster necrorhizus MCA 3950]KAG7450879.1 hypothetical protein BT62DRAFT_1001726 [Guyanagaster necrorhizus MCA 3950]
MAEHLGVSTCYLYGLLKRQRVIETHNLLALNLTPQIEFVSSNSPSPITIASHLMHPQIAKWLPESEIPVNIVARSATSSILTSGSFEKLMSLNISYQWESDPAGVFLLDLIPRTSPYLEFLELNRNRGGSRHDLFDTKIEEDRPTTTKQGMRQLGHSLSSLRLCFMARFDIPGHGTFSVAIRVYDTLLCPYLQNSMYAIIPYGLLMMRVHFLSHPHRDVGERLRSGCEIRRNHDKRIGELGWCGCEEGAEGGCGRNLDSPSVGSASANETLPFCKTDDTVHALPTIL